MYFILTVTRTKVITKRTNASQKHQGTEAVHFPSLTHTQLVMVLSA